MEVNITDGSISRAEPSTLDTEIVEGSISQALTILAKRLYHGRFDGINMNRPRWRSISRTVRWYQYEPSTLEARITDSSVSRAEPSTLNTEIVDGSITNN